MNIHPRAACGIFSILWFSLFLLFYKVMKIYFDFPFFIVFPIFSFIPLNLIDKYFTNRYKKKRDESIYYDETFRVNPFEKEKIDESKE